MEGSRIDGVSWKEVGSDWAMDLRIEDHLTARSLNKREPCQKPDMAHENRERIGGARGQRGHVPSLRFARPVRIFAGIFRSQVSSALNQGENKEAGLLNGLGVV